VSEKGRLVVCLQDGDANSGAGMGGFPIYFVPYGAVRFSVDVNVQEWEVSFFFFIVNCILLRSPMRCFRNSVIL
jgi:hypothetical protein